MARMLCSRRERGSPVRPREGRSDALAYLALASQWLEPAWGKHWRCALAVSSCTAAIPVREDAEIGSNAGTLGRNEIVRRSAGCRLDDKRSADVEDDRLQACAFFHPRRDALPDAKAPRAHWIRRRTRSSASAPELRRCHVVVRSPVSYRQPPRTRLVPVRYPPPRRTCWHRPGEARSPSASHPRTTRPSPGSSGTPRSPARPG